MYQLAGCALAGPSAEGLPRMKSRLARLRSHLGLRFPFQAYWLHTLLLATVGPRPQFLGRRLFPATGPLTRHGSSLPPGPPGERLLLSS